MRLHYSRRPEFERAEDKLGFLGQSSIAKMSFTTSYVNDDGIWLNRTENNFESLIATASKEVQLSKIAEQNVAIFKAYSLGVSTNRDDWLYDHDIKQLKQKILYFSNIYNRALDKSSIFPDIIKWSESLKRRKKSGNKEEIDWKLVQKTLYCPFSQMMLYQSKLFIDRPGLSEIIFSDTQKKLYD